MTITTAMPSTAAPTSDIPQPLLAPSSDSTTTAALPTAPVVTTASPSAGFSPFPTARPTNPPSSAATTISNTNVTSDAFETTIVLTLSCIELSDALNETLRAVLTDLAEVQYPESEVISITVDSSEDGECRYTVTMTVVSQDEEETDALRAYALDDEGLSADVVNGVEAALPELGDV